MIPALVPLSLIAVFVIGMAVGAGLLRAVQRHAERSAP